MVMKYEEPNMQVFVIDGVDLVRTSNVGEGTGPVKGDETTWPI